MVVTSSPCDRAEIRIPLVRSWCHGCGLSGVRVVFSQIEAIRVKSHLDGVWSSAFRGSRESLSRPIFTYYGVGSHCSLHGHHKWHCSLLHRPLLSRLYEYGCWLWSDDVGAVACLYRSIALQICLPRLTHFVVRNSLFFVVIRRGLVIRRSLQILLWLNLSIFCNFSFYIGWFLDVLFV